MSAGPRRIGPPMSASDDLRSAQDHLAAGRLRPSLRAAWRATDAALREGDTEALRSVIVIAEQAQQSPDPRVARDAERLLSYCQHTLDGAGGGVESHSVLARLSRIRRPRRTCPDCAERIPAEARVCRYCGFRFEHD
jgi:hypothetical protein